SPRTAKSPVGALLWAAIYASVGLAAAQAWLAAAARSPVGATTVTVVLVAAVLAVVVHRRVRAS
ncbi:hypothetical protein ABC138_16415, partial [Janibacter sp. LM]